MTPEECEEYNKLSKEGKHFYDLIRDKHPDWSHIQIMVMVILESSMPDIVVKVGNIK